MIIENIKFEIPKREVLLSLKFNVKSSQMTPEVERLIDNMIDEGYILSEPIASFKTVEILENKENKITFKNTDYIIESEAISKLFKNSYKATFMVATIGVEITDAIKNFLEDGDISKATVLDAVSSEAVEAVVNSLNTMFNYEDKSEKTELTRRFSPGYGDWGVENNKSLLDFLESKKIGVTLSSTNLMLPEKSITACFGWGKI